MKRCRKRRLDLNLLVTLLVFRWLVSFILIYHLNSLIDGEIVIEDFMVKSVKVANA